MLAPPRHRRPALRLWLSTALAGLLCLFAIPTTATANVPGAALYSPSAGNEGMAYTRMVRLQHSGSADGTLLASFEHWTTDGSASYYDIRRSTDDGASWSTLSSVLGDTYSYQPFLFEYPQQLGAYPAGTLLLVGATLPANRAGVTFREWRSTDHGATWSYVGAPQTSAGADGSGIWEPFVGLDSSGKLLMYFSDERQNATYSQFLGHIVSTDGGDTWSAAPDGSTRVAPGEVKDVASTTQADRPGMITIAKVPATGSYVASYEVCGPLNCQVHLKTSTDGDTWGSGPADLGTVPRTDDGRQLYNTPVIAWSPAGGADGELLLTAMNESRLAGGAPENHQIVFTNTSGGSGNWSWMPSPIAVPTAGAAPSCGADYSPDLLPSSDGSTVRYSAAGVAGPYGCQELTGSGNAGVLPYTAALSSSDPGWTQYGGSWSASGGSYTETSGGSGGNKSVTGSTGWTDYTLEGDVQLGSVGANGNAGFLLRTTDPSSGTDSSNGYYIGAGTSSLTIGREGYGWTQLAATAIPGGLASGSWYHLTVQVSGCTVSVQGRPAGSWSNPAYLSVNDCTFSHGSVGVRDFNTTAAWRDLTVRTSAAATGPGTTGKCVDVDTNGNANGNKVQLWDCNRVPGQQWTAAADGTLRAFGKCLDVVGDATANYSKVELWDCNGVGGQQWVPRADGSLYNPQSGRCLDDPSDVTANGTQLQIYDCNQLSTQVWHLP
ncbi:ricin-type beta-trefoil lectin domain protein [Streptacidiphilus carbonis]|uniref:ricin-type beta-trefoil lectin domain protein n=1 Tax=Streptacidiphilus carbonis TaxID=105422 RepID=UPI0005A77E74|nr:ricin-type beta-trefoil lectin domain protein [Streptacidiphilus carbonis]